MRSYVLLLALVTCLTSASVPAQETLIPRDALFGNPDRVGVNLSPDGRAISWIAPWKDVMNIWVAPRDDLEKARAVTHDTGRGVRRYRWAEDGRHLLYLQDQGGDEKFHVYSLDLVSSQVIDLTPFDGVSARFQKISREFPHEILLAVNDRSPMLHDIHRVDIRTGERTVVLENEGFVGFLTNDQYENKLAFRIRPDGGQDVLRHDGEIWKPFMTVPTEDSMTTQPVGFGADGVVYMNDSRGRDTAALVALDMNSGEKTLIAQDDRADASGVMLHPTDHTVQAARFNYERTAWQIFDEVIGDDIKHLRTVEEGDVGIASRTHDDRYWIVAFTRDDGPVRYYCFDRVDRNARFLFTNREALKGLPLARMHPTVIDARDGLKLVSYLSLPPSTDRDGDARPTEPLPMVLLVHGGPWARDSFGYNPIHQWLANRGYAVLSVNFRGSTGFGKNFVNAANEEWAGKMHDDLLDAVAWATKNKIADPEKVAIMGGSYGGYATLVGLTFTPDTFACGVDIVGPSNLVTLMKSVPPYWKPMLDMMTTRVGDHRTEEGKKLLEERSPLTRVSAISKPLLIGQGANDPRVKQAESDQIVSAMTKKGIPVTYALYPNEGHGFRRPENNTSFFAVTESFLGAILGGKIEPIGDDLEGSSLQVPVGAERIKGLKEALDKRAKKP